MGQEGGSLITPISLTAMALVMLTINACVKCPPSPAPSRRHRAPVAAGRALSECELARYITSCKWESFAAGTRLSATAFRVERGRREVEFWQTDDPCRPLTPWMVTATDTIQRTAVPEVSNLYRKPHRNRRVICIDFVDETLSRLFIQKGIALCMGRDMIRLSSGVSHEAGRHLSESQH